MDPCHFLRIVIGNLAIKHPSSNPTSYYCKIKFLDFPTQLSPIPLLPPDTDTPPPSPSVSACFTLTRHLLSSNPNLSKSKPSLKLHVYSGRPNGSGCFGPDGRLLGRVTVPVDLGSEGKVMQNGWVLVGKNKAQLYLSVKAQPDPRFVFEFDGEPECSPQVFQVQGCVRQPVFTCKFSLRQSGDWNSRSSSTMSEPSTSRSWLSSLKHDKSHHNHNNHQSKERKGWSITIHDLSGSPVAAASMVTPFVPSQGTNRVSKSNPGAWLILRPGDNTWKPWGRLEAWRESGSNGGLGHSFSLLPEMGPTSGITLAQSAVPASRGGKFSIDITTNTGSPSGSPNGSFDFASWSGSGSGGSGSSCGSETGWWPGFMYRGFVMSSTVGGEGRASRPVVEVGAQHVTCTEDAAVFVALAAAVDLSMDACIPFSRKLRKELRKELSGEFVV